MVYVTGDTHGSQEKWIYHIHPTLKPGDTIIVAGDFGFGFFDGRFWPEEMFYDWISEQPYTVLVVDGNHENFDRLSAYPPGTFAGGSVGLVRKNLLHLRRGEIYCIDGHTIFVFGGGFSQDKCHRVPGKSWWSQEMPCDKEYQNARVNLESCGYHVDNIITHTAPSQTVCFMGMKESPEEYPLASFLDRIQSSVTYKHWYFGHFHKDVDLWRDQTAVYNCIRALEPLA